MNECGTGKGAFWCVIADGSERTMRSIVPTLGGLNQAVIEGRWVGAMLRIDRGDVVFDSGGLGEEGGDV
ncbi:hypothetical protein CMV30_11350 [Nibricoccus aquaticus]|uniref:Uncharacterized protein n=1 Tax=Nibricoccus aquaticus TaxID=2576891 RepID=A0A290Q775_9BACT|nr:hypothetical protein CMV30_11350 [Nibricoccus aquaticus]